MKAAIYHGIPCTCALSNLEGGTMQGCVCCTALMRSNQAETLTAVEHSEVPYSAGNCRRPKIRKMLKIAKISDFKITVRHWNAMA